MSRRHFEALALEISYITDVQARKLAALAVANAGARSNDRFDRSRFYKACGL